MNSKTITKQQLAKMFDHTNLKAFALESDFDILCNEAKDNHFAMVAINSFPVKYCKKILNGTDVHVGAAISFPLGQTTVETKVAEVINSINDGADEIDYVLNVGKVKEGNFVYIKDEMERIVQVCKENNKLVKVILEICYLTNQEIEKVCEIAKEVKPDFVKTSTGFGTGGATVEAVKLMKDTVGEGIQVKAAGGIRSWETAAKMIDAGATRLGTSSAFIILEGFNNR
jgi:deoxyribose-phosphate aldolase